jgi:hypothetical protein
MNLRETSEVLARAAAYDYRTVGESDIRAWHDALSDLDVDACGRAVVAHYRESTDRLMPAHVRRLVTAEAREDHERRHSENLARMLAGVDASVGDARAEATKALLAELRDSLPAVSSSLVFRRAEWRDADRARRPDRVGDADVPNPLFTGAPPPGGFPVPDDADPT